MEKINLHVHASMQRCPTDYYRTELLTNAHNRRWDEEEDVVIYNRQAGGYGKLETCLEIIAKYPNLKKIVHGSHGESSNIIFYDEETLVVIDEYESSLSISIDSLDEKLSSNLEKEFNETLVKTPPKGSVMMLAHQNGNFFLTELGEIDCPLERENYTDKILRQYDNVIADLQTNTPGGRLTLLDGLPGSGKSFLIRGIITEAQALYVYIPASISGQITGPDIIPVFIGHRENDLPIVLIMEDADATLATRQIDNVGRLSDLLNMSDGILGEMADLRIIATTNAKSTEIDEAVKRDGRVNEHINFSILSGVHAQEVFNRLTGRTDKHPIFSETMQSGKWTLAKIYSLAREHGWRPKQTRKPRKNNARLRYSDPFGGY